MEKVDLEVSDAESLYGKREIRGGDLLHFEEVFVEIRRFVEVVRADRKVGDALRSHLSSFPGGRGKVYNELSL
jgi:hypothetical protein